MICQFYFVLGSILTIFISEQDVRQAHVLNTQVLIEILIYTTNLHILTVERLSELRRLLTLRITDINAVSIGYKGQVL